jgi:hypothetical protein
MAVTSILHLNLPLDQVAAAAAVTLMGTVQAVVVWVFWGKVLTVLLEITP